MDPLIFLEFLVAFCIRLWLSSSDYRQVISDRVEISTPLNSWKRVTEGVFLYNGNVDPYIGDVFHETPVGLVIFHWLIRSIPHYIHLVFISCDLVTAYLLYETAKKCVADLMKRQSLEQHTYAAGVEKLLLCEEELSTAPLYVLSAYLFNPYLILSCAAQTTTVFSNLCLAIAYLSMSKGYGIVFGLSLALCTLQTLYPITLVVPACLIAAKSDPIDKMNAVGCLILLFFFSLHSLIAISHHIMGSWNFVYSTYIFILNVHDLRPNIGLFWYFFTEMFEHFRVLFVSAFQLNATVLYVAPLALRLHKDPLLLATSLSALGAIFRSYPSVGDVGFYLALLPMWKHLFHYMQQGFVVGCFFVVTSILAPVLWHLWIYCRSANANFYFGVTLAFASAQIFLITDILFAYIKREFALKNGVERTINGVEAKLVLE